MFLLGAGFLALVLVGTGCSGAAKNKLLVADASGASAEGVKIWAAAPGDDLDDDNLVTDAAVSPASIATRLDDGTTWVNGLGRDWSDTTLLSYAGPSNFQLLSSQPGGDATQLAQSTSLQPTVIRRGVYVRTAEGCVLATDSTSTEQIGSGACSISSDERWVVSWPGTATTAQAAADPAVAALTIRDLRHDDDLEIADLGTVTNAVALAADARVFAVVQTGDGGYQGVVLDATDGSEVGRTEVFPYLDVSTLGAESTGFVILTSTEQGNSTLSYVDTDADVTEIEAGFYLVPVGNDGEVTYLSFATDGISDSAVRSWSPGDDEPETLLTGQVGAGTADGELVIIREVSAEENAAGGAPAPENGAPMDGDSEDGEATGPTVEFWRPGSAHRLTRVLSIPAPADTTSFDDGGAGATVSKVWVRGDTAYLQVDHTTVSSFVRIDLTGDHSDAPIQNSEGLLLESLDADGTALLTVAGGEGEDILVVGPHSEEPVVRGSFARTALNLIHEGVIYVTEVSGSDDAPTLSVRSIRSTGNRDPELLWEDRQLAGATWPEQNGATTTSITTIGSIIAAQQAAAEAQQDAAGATGAGTAAAGAGTADPGTAAG